MAMLHRLIHRMAGNFHRPQGLLGVAVGLHMHRFNAERNSMLVALAGLQPGDRALDVGCGPGAAVATAAAAAVDGVRATGVDASPTMVRLARRLHRRAVRSGSARFVEGRADRLPFGDGEFTVAWSMNSYHHWPDGEAGLREIHRVLAAGGRVLICESLPRPGRRIGPPGLGDADVASLAGAMVEASFGDVTQAALGKAWVVAAIIVGALLSGFVSTNFAVASGVAFLLSEAADFAVYTPLQRRGWIRAVAASNAVGLVFDSALFLWLAFDSLDFLPGQVLGKTWMTLLAVVALLPLRSRLQAAHAG